MAGSSPSKMIGEKYRISVETSFQSERLFFLKIPQLSDRYAIGSENRHKNGRFFHG
jgi:hypothetical protein